jgi:hypothetical protein
MHLRQIVAPDSITGQSVNVLISYRTKDHVDHFQYYRVEELKVMLAGVKLKFLYLYLQG